MAADASAYAALGLEPDADSAAVERAYKRLIKQHHPDRAGGDARRAAEINRAYRELRSGGRETLELRDQVYAQERQVRGAVLLLAAAGALTLLLVGGPLAEAISTPVAVPAAPIRAVVQAPAADPINDPLALASVEGGIRDALSIARSGDEVALASASRDCHRELRAKPSIARLDRCAAFDDTVIQLQDRDPLRDRGPFSELAVTGRLMSGGTLLSNDALAIDSRLDRVRVHVELALAPPALPPESGDQAN